jgi:hypothetical protein
MAEVNINSLFRPSAAVKLYKRKSSEPLGPQLDEVIGHGTVDEESKLRIAGVPAGMYWAVVDGQSPVAVTAKDGGKIARVTEDRRRTERATADGDVRDDDATVGEGSHAAGADALTAGDPKAHEAPVRSRDIVTGPRTSANTRIKAEGEQAKPSLTERAKAATGRRRK